MLSAGRRLGESWRMNRAIVDSSVLLAVLRREPNAGQFLDAIQEAVVGTVNLAEVVSKLVSRGLSEGDAWREARSVADRIVPFDMEQSRIAGELICKTKRSGLSLGDRACLALAITMELPVYTADRAWEDVQVGVEIHLVR